MKTLLTISGDSPDAASTAQVGAPMRNLSQFSHLWIDAFLVGATGGTLDIYLQRKVTDDVWADWAHFAQLSAGGAAVHYSIAVARASTAIVTTGGGSDSTPAPALAAGALLGSVPGELRCIAVAGAGTSAGAAVLVHINGE